ncbi:MAG TPA: flavodoxin family protein [Caldithrix sp.]|nr:flavodoxin family protein [Caldithrix sp.]
MRVLAFNGSPREKGNTSALIAAILEGASSKGAQTTEIRLHDINLKGCMGCLSCRGNIGHCKQKDDLSTYLEEIKSAGGIVMGCPIYMYRISGQMKLLVDRMYSLYANLPEGGYKSMVPAGKTYALVVSQGANNPELYQKSIRYLAGMTGSGLGMEEVGRIIQANSEAQPAAKNQSLLNTAFEIGVKLVKNSRN